MHAVRRDVIATCYTSSMALDRIEPSLWIELNTQIVLLTQ